MHVSKFEPKNGESEKKSREHECASTSSYARKSKTKKKKKGVQDSTLERKPSVKVFKQSDLKIESERRVL